MQLFEVDQYKWLYYWVDYHKIFFAWFNFIIKGTFNVLWFYLPSCMNLIRKCIMHVYINANISCKWWKTRFASLLIMSEFLRE